MEGDGETGQQGLEGLGAIKQMSKSKTEWRPLPGFSEYEVSSNGELRGAKSKNMLNLKQHAAIWRKIKAEGLPINNTAEATPSSATTARERRRQARQAWRDRPRKERGPWRPVEKPEPGQVIWGNDWSETPW
jgi:hypothetical protein